MVDCDGEIWEEVPSLLGYEASSRGRLRTYLADNTLENFLDEPILVESMKINHCLKVIIFTKSLRKQDAWKKWHYRSLAYLVTEAFHGKRQSKRYRPHQINGKWWDVRPENLKWRRRRSVKRRAKLDEKKVYQIRCKLANGEKAIDLALLYEVSTATISKIRYNDKWKSVGGPTESRQERASEMVKPAEPPAATESTPLWDEALEKAVEKTKTQERLAAEEEWARMEANESPKSQEEPATESLEEDF